MSDAVTFSEWAAPFNGFIATCVEVAGEILRGTETGVQVTAGNVQGAAQQLFTGGLADARGATTFGAEQGVLAGEGIQTQLLSIGQDSATQLQQTVQGILQSGHAAGIGFGNATALQDTISGQFFDRGVFGHAAVIEGADQSGALVADPNTAPGTGLVHYTWQNLVDAGANQLLVPTGSSNAGQPFSLSSSGTTLAATPPASVFGGILPAGSADVAGSGIGALFSGLNVPAAIGKATNNVLTTIQQDLFKAALLWLSLVALVAGLLVLFWEPLTNKAMQAANVAGAVVDPVAKVAQASAASKTARANVANAETYRQAVGTSAKQLYLQGAKDSPRVTGAEGGRRSGAARRARKNEAPAAPGSAEAIQRGTGRGMTEAQRAKFREGLGKAKENLGE